MNKLAISLPNLIPLAVLVGLVLLLILIGRIPLGYNIRNLAVRWKVTIMTALAFTMVVGLLTTMLGFVNGMRKLTEGSGQPGNVIALSDGATDELFSNLGFGDTRDLGNKVAPELRNLLEKDDQGNVLLSREVYIVGNQPVPTAPGEPARRRFLQIRGIDDPIIASKVHGLNLLEGEWFSAAGVGPLNSNAAAGSEESKETAIQAVIGEGVARELGKDVLKPRLTVGDVFALGPNQEAQDVRVRKWKVVGVMDSAGSSFDSEIWAKQGLVGPMFGKNNYTSLVIRTRDANAASQIAKDLNDHVKEVKAQPETEYYAKMAETSKQFLYSIYFVAGVMAVGGIFGVMNTMFAAISQRKKDIGVLRILGYARWQVLVSFLLESLFIALLGGLIGCALGYLTNGWTATSILSSGAGGGGKTVILKLIVDANTLAAGILFTLLMGSLGGFIPSLSAMRQKPLESLR